MKNIQQYFEDVFDVSRSPQEMLKGHQLDFEVCITDVKDDVVTVKNTGKGRDYVIISPLNISKYEELANLGINKIIYDQNLIMALEGNKGLNFHDLCFECNKNNVTTNINAQKNLPLSNIIIKTNGVVRFDSETKKPIKLNNVNIDCRFLVCENVPLPFFSNNSNIKLSHDIIQPNGIIYVELHSYEYTEMIHVLQRFHDTKYLDKILGINNIPLKLLKNTILLLHESQNTYIMVHKSNPDYEKVLSNQKKIWGDSYNNHLLWAGDWIFEAVDETLKKHLKNLNII